MSAGATCRGAGVRSRSPLPRAVELLGRYPDTKLRVRWYDRWTSKEKRRWDFLWKEGEPPPGAHDPITEIAPSFTDEVAES